MNILFAEWFLIFAATAGFWFTLKDIDWFSRKKSELKRFWEKRKEANTIKDSELRKLKEAKAIARQAAERQSMKASVRQVGATQFPCQNPEPVDYEKRKGDA